MTSYQIKPAICFKDSPIPSFTAIFFVYILFHGKKVDNSRYFQLIIPSIYTAPFPWYLQTVDSSSSQKYFSTFHLERSTGSSPSEASLIIDLNTEVFPQPSVKLHLPRLEIQYQTDFKLLWAVLLSLQPTILMILTIRLKVFRHYVALGPLFFMV